MSRGIRKESEEKYKEEYKNKILGLITLHNKRTFTELLEALGISRPALTKYIKELENEKLILWKRDPDNRRSGFYVIGDKFNESDYFKNKALALWAFVTYVAPAIEEAKKVFDRKFHKTKDIEEQERILENAQTIVEREVGKGFIYISYNSKSIGKPLIDALLTYQNLVNEYYFELEINMSEKVFSISPDDLEDNLLNQHYADYDIFPSATEDIKHMFGILCELKPEFWDKERIKELILSD